jgi:hypothetical protein
MTNPPPDELAFFGFFEVEPTKLDADVPWVYNTSTYEIDRDGYLVRCELSPSYLTLKVTLVVAGRELVAAEIAPFTTLEIATNGASETLIARFGESTASAFLLTLRPHVRFAFAADS